MDNLISRQAALDIYDDYNVAVENGELEAYRKHRERLLELPPTERWIPCKTKLPDDDTEVIVSCTDDSGDGEFSYVTTGWHYKGLWVVNNDRCYFVKAWQPLPAKPWEGEQDESDD